MSIAKQKVRSLLDYLPDNVTLDDIHYHLYVLEKIQRGQDDIANGRHYTSEQARAYLRQWLNP